MISSDLTVQLLIFRFLAGVIIATVHGATLALVAVWLGDQGPKHDGRLTLSPVRHLDLLGTVSILLSGFGWSKPLAIEAEQFRLGRWGLVIVVLAGSAALLAVSLLLTMLVIPALTMLPYTAGLAVSAFLRVAARLCVWMAMFSLLPLPPLAGGHFLVALGIKVPPAAVTFFALGLLIVSSLGFTRTLLMPAYDIVAPLLLAPGSLA